MINNTATYQTTEMDNRAAANIAKEDFAKLRPWDEKSISFFKAPITNIYPLCSMSLRECAFHIKNSRRLADLTSLYRDIDNTIERKIFKKTEFPYVTFAGTFKTRKNKNLVKPSGLMTLDVDDEKDPEKTKSRLAEDTDLGALLIFTTMSNHGLKIIVDIDLSQYSYEQWFRIFDRYLIKTWGLVIDHSGSDIARASFLCHDPKPVINF